MRLFFRGWLLLLPFFLSACFSGHSGSDAKPIKIAVNPWIGYTPFMYLHATGELEKLGFRLVLVSSLGENANLLSNHLVDGFAATQYEYLNYKDELKGIVPVFTIDRSNGADKVHSNVDIATLQKSDRPIHVYMEFGSCNEDIFKSFVRAYALKKKRFIYHHDPQSVIKNLSADPGKPVIVVSYEPFSTALQKHGIREVASSRNLDILIVDALFASVSDIRRRKARFLALKEAFWRAKRELDKDPRRFYGTVRNFLEGQDYASFQKSLGGIRWLEKPGPDIIDTLKKQGIDTGYLL